jgi:vacuolar iron transporter family protein
MQAIDCVGLEDSAYANAHWAAISWWRSGGDTLAIGLGAAALAFLVGHGLKSLV